MKELKIFQACFLALVSIKAPVHAKSTIACNRTSLQINDVSLVAKVQVMIDEDDLEITTSITFDGIADSDDPIVFLRTKVKTSYSDEDEKQVIWNGALEGEIGYATFFQSRDGVLSGSFITPDAAYSLSTLANGETQVRRTEWQNFADTDATHEPQNAFVRSSTKTTESMAVDSVIYPKKDAMVIIKEDSMEATIGYPTRSLRSGHNRTLQSKTVVDVLVIVTNRAMCEYAGLPYGCETSDVNRRPLANRIPILEDQTNEAMQQVGVNVEIRVVQIIFLAGNFDGRPSASTLNTLVQDNNANQWRRDAGADLVTIITGSDYFVPGQRGITCGIAYLYSHVSATGYNCLDSLTFTHELGHNFGANHERNNVPSSIHHPYGHGYQNGNRYRTVMAYNCPGGCPQAPFFSANGYVLVGSGLPLGDAQHDNARLISENALRVANFMNTVAAPVTPPVPPPDTKLTCPASNKCPGQNLVKRTFSQRCFDECVPEGSFMQRLVSLLGYVCGGC